jgi:CO dehydrogenase/acetyl-CoA synthase gamma subunit (corrinoid Fe-S protein)
MANILSFANREARMWEISDNLQRAELTKLERSDQIAEWVKLCDEKREKVSSQVQSKAQGGSPEQAERTAARELGLDKDEVNRSVKIASITPEAKEAAIDVGIDNNETKMLHVAEEESEKQVAAVHRLATI